MIRLTELEEKLTYLSQLLDELRAGIPPSLPEYASEPLTKRGCERLVQLAVECAGDICSLATEIKDQPAPYSLYQSFIDASNAGIMPTAFARELAEWTKIRNRLVHDYDRVDDATMYNSLQPVLKHFSEFVKHVQEFVEGQSSADG